jgi:hypothetical protein
LKKSRHRKIAALTDVLTLIFIVFFLAKIFKLNFAAKVRDKNEIFYGQNRQNYGQNRHLKKKFSTVFVNLFKMSDLENPSKSIIFSTYFPLGASPAKWNADDTDNADLYRIIQDLCRILQNFTQDLSLNIRSLKIREYPRYPCHPRSMISKPHFHLIFLTKQPQ